MTSILPHYMAGPTLKRAVGNIYWIWWGKREKRDRETHKVGQLGRWEGVNMSKIYWNSQRIKKYYFKKFWLWVTLGLFPILKIFAANSSQQLKKKKSFSKKSCTRLETAEIKMFSYKILKKKRQIHIPILGHLLYIWKQKNISFSNQIYFCILPFPSLPYQS